MPRQKSGQRFSGKPMPTGKCLSLSMAVCRGSRPMPPCLKILIDITSFDLLQRSRVTRSSHEAFTFHLFVYGDVSARRNGHTDADNGLRESSAKPASGPSSN